MACRTASALGRTLAHRRPSSIRVCTSPHHPAPLARRPLRRQLTGTARVGSAPEIFHRRTKRLQKDRVAEQPDFADYTRIKDEIGWQLADRVHDVNRCFPLGLDLGCNSGFVGRYVDKEAVSTLVQTDISRPTLDTFTGECRDAEHRVCLDEEARLPFRPDSFDLVTSSLSLHWVNDLPGTLAKIHRILRPDGAFMGVMFCGDTLFQLRVALQLAELERLGGFSPHISPLIDVRDVGGLLQRAGFVLLTVDVDELTVNYPSIFELMDDLRGMGESNAATKRATHLKRDTLMAAAAIYERMYGNGDGTIPATFQVVHMCGWTPAKDQAQPLPRGSAEVSLKDLNQALEQLQTGTQDDGKPQPPGSS